MTVSYKDAGVDVEAGNQFVKSIAGAAQSTHSKQVLSGLGGFSGLFEMPSGFREPVLVSGTDGVGTKLKLIVAADRHEVAGIDAFAMVINDLIVVGAQPLFFLDYFACGKLDKAAAQRVVEGMASACRESDCALVGGETAEMPGMYAAGDYDIAGFGVGVVERQHIRDGSALQEGDVLVGLPSAGVHSNGFSLVRRLLETHNIGLDYKPEALAGTVADALLAPTRVYTKALSSLDQEQFVAAAHITGGGLVENPPRMLADETLAVRLHTHALPCPPVFRWLQSLGVTPQEMALTFNLGIGMLIACRASAKTSTLAKLAPWQPLIVGEIVARKKHALEWTEPCDSLF